VDTLDILTLQHLRKIIIHTIHSIKLRKSSGYDEVTSQILKACTTLCSHPFSYIYNHSLQTGIFPESLTIALYNRGDKPTLQITGLYHN
jgi:hypothetical protein